MFSKYIIEVLSILRVNTPSANNAKNIYHAMSFRCVYYVYAKYIMHVICSLSVYFIFLLGLLRTYRGVYSRTLFCQYLFTYFVLSIFIHVLCFVNKHSNFLYTVQKFIILPNIMSGNFRVRFNTKMF